MRHRAYPNYRLEGLESRLVLSASLASAALGTHAAAPADPTIDTRRYRIDSFLAGSFGTYGDSWTNPDYTQAQQFFNRFHDI